MKIEVDLMRMAMEPDVGRPVVVALLCTLPQDAAELAVAEWQAVLKVRLVDEVAQLDAEAIPYEVAANAATAVAAIEDELRKAEARGLGIDAGTPLEQCGLSVKTVNALQRAGLKNLGDLTTWSAERLLTTVDRFGKGALAEVEAALAHAGLALADAGASAPEPARAGPPTPRADLLDAGNGEAKPPQDLRELLRAAEHHLGRAKVWELMQAQGVAKLSQVTPAAEAALRKAITEAMT